MVGAQLPALRERRARRWRKTPAQRRERVMLVLLLLTLVGGLAGVVGGIHIGNGEEPPTDWAFERMHADVTVRPDGVVEVREAFDVDFDRRPYHGVVRVLPRRGPHSETHDRRVEIVARGGRVDVGAEVVEVRTGAEGVLVSGPQHFEIGYEVIGAVEADGDEVKLVWNVTGHEWAVPIGHVTADVTMPGRAEAACFAGPSGSTRPCASVTGRGETATFEHGRLRPGEELTATVRAPAGAVQVPDVEIVRKPGWRAAFHVRASTVVATALTTVVFLGAALARVVRGRDRLRGGSAERLRRPGEKISGPVSFRIPTGLKPAQVGLIADEFVDPDDVAATMVDLARRGHLVIKDRERGGEWEWVLARGHADPGDLEPFETRLLEGIFRGRDGSVPLVDLAGTFDEDYDAVAGLLYADALERRWFVGHPHRLRRRFFLVGWFGTIAAATALIAAYETSTWALPFVPPLLAALLVLFAWSRMPARTVEGTAVLAEIRGFERYLATADVETLRFAQDQGELFAALPYAMALGLTDRWVRVLGPAAAELPEARWALPLCTRTDGTVPATNFAGVVAVSLGSGPGASAGGGSSNSAGGGFGGGGGGVW